MRKIPLLLFLWIITLPLLAQEQQKFKFDHFIESEAFGDERQITVYLPPSYYKNPEQQFTVTYVLDGHFAPFIDFAAASIGYNSYMHKYTPTIVVGVHAKDRGWEFSAPLTEAERQEYQGGRAPELQQHFRAEIFPLIDSLYTRTLPFRSIIGHSSGGAFVLYTLFGGGKDLFDGYIGISPALRPGEHTVFKDAATRLAAGEKFAKFLYCSVGTIGEREETFGAGLDRLDSILTAYPAHGLIWRTSVFEDMDHWTCVGPSFNTSMVELTKGFRVDEKRYTAFANNKEQTMTEQIKAFYQNRKEEYGFVDIPSAKYLYRIAWNLSIKDKSQDALEIYDWALTQYPQNYHLTKSKAKLLLKLKEYERAYAIFTDCISILEKEKTKRSAEEYAQQKEYLEEKLEASKGH